MKKTPSLQIQMIIFLALFIPISGLCQSPSFDKLNKLLSDDYPYLDALYKHLHMNPELSFHEEQTAKRIGSELKKLGFTVTHGVGGHGFVGVLINGFGPTVMVRTDLDALPVKENTGLDYASKIRTKDDQGNEVSVMHACGHDIHMTSLVGTARMLVNLKDSWGGTLVMIGQPAEERGVGARMMLTDGLFQKFPRPDYALALHASATVPAGKVAYREEFILANVDMVDVTVYGEGGHGAYPHTTKDPIVLAAQIILNLQTIVSREISPLEPAVVTVGSIHGGTKHNIIPDEVKLQLTLRSYSDEVRQKTIEAIQRICRGVAKGAGISENKLPKIAIRNEYTPATYNDPNLTRRTAQVFMAILGEENVLETGPVMAGEDFGRYGREEPKIPISIFWLGAIDPKKVEESKKTGKGLPSLHSALFAPLPEPAIKTGVKAMTAVVLDLMKR